jgi:hypothetical protein
MRSDLGRLDAIAEILQVRPPLGAGPVLGGAVRAVVYSIEKTRPNVPKESVMRMLSAAAMLVLLTAPAYAQTPNINLIPELQSKSPEEKEAEAARDKAYKDSLKKIPETKTSSDPWGAVRSTDAPKTAAPAKPKTKTGSSAQRSQ